MKMGRATSNSNRVWDCDVCGAKCSSPSDLKKHMRVHTGEKPYQCQDCRRKFSTTSSYNRHVRIHTGAKPYQCTECDHRFRTSSSFARHRRVHIGERGYTCEICRKKFSNSWGLTRHQKILSHAGMFVGEEVREGQDEKTFKTKVGILHYSLRAPSNSFAKQDVGNGVVRKLNKPVKGVSEEQSQTIRKVPKMKNDDMVWCVDPLMVARYNDFKATFELCTIDS